MQAVVAGELENFAKFPPRQKPASFNLDAVMEQVTTHVQARPIIQHGHSIGRMPRIGR